MKQALTIAGSDSGGGAGIQADVKTMAAHGVYAATVITAVTAQNTAGVRPAVDRLLVAVAADAVLVKDRLDVAREVEHFSLGDARDWRYLARLTLRRGEYLRNRRRHFSMFVTADAPG